MCRCGDAVDLHDRSGCLIDGCPCYRPIETLMAEALPHTHKWGGWGPDRLQPQNGLEYAWCLCGASKARLVGADHEDACPVRTGEEGPRQGMCLCHVEKEAPKAPGENHDFVSWEHCDPCARAWDAQLAGVRMIPRSEPKPPTPRPPYAVAYAVQGGALYEVALPGDATAAAEGGRLVITHSGMPVTGIVRVAPMRIEEA
jgi:hypothetical protein